MTTKLLAILCLGALASCAGLRRDDGRSHRHHPGGYYGKQSAAPVDSAPQARDSAR